MAPAIPCTVGECTWTSPAQLSSEVAMQLLLMHRQDIHSDLDAAPAPLLHAPVQSAGKVERPHRPTVTAGMSETDWNFFLHEWGRYTRQTGIQDVTLRDELWSCMESDLRQLAFSEGYQAATEAELLKQIKELSVTVLHPSVHIVALHQMKQQDGETVKAFSARVKGTASNCNLTKICSKTGCTQTNSFLEETCYHVVMSGISDIDLNEKVLTQAMLGNVKDLPSLLNYVAAEESAKSKISGVHEQGQVSGVGRPPSGHVKNKTKRCGHCGQSQHGENNQNRATQCKALGKECSNCHKPNHFAGQCKSGKATTAAAVKPAKDKPDDEGENVEVAAVTGFLSAMLTESYVSTPENAAPLIQALRESTLAPVTTLPIPHYVFNEQEQLWKQTPPSPPPVITVSASLDRSAYGQLKLNPPRFTKRAGAGHARGRRATTDTGAMLCVINVSELLAMGIKADTIFSVATNVNTVTKASVDLIGGIFLVFTSSNKATGEIRHTRQLCYVSKTVPGIYLSEDACIALGCVPPTFPSVGECDSSPTSPQAAGVTVATPASASVAANSSAPASLPPCENTGVLGPHQLPCKCPKRAPPPTTPPVLPCEPTVENLPIIKKYILERYSSSAFNCCEQQVLPLMSDAPPLRLFVDEHATPTAVTSPCVVPSHWVADVKAGLERDERLGVIERIPVNTPDSWCSRMVVTPKHDGTPRRVIDYAQVNKHAPRQTHHTKSPYTIATSIPGGKVKSVLDNWHGYHSVPVHPADRHLTQFLTQWGKYQYRTCPQGFISAGDGYTHRMDLIVGNMEDYEHCVDDSLIWDDDIASNFDRVCAFLAKCSSAGCVFNPKKFQFGEREVDFLGFTITDTGIKPQAAFISSIRDFSQPQNLTDCRSFFGLVNQVSYSFASAVVMQPFRHLLSSKVPFYWSEELQSAFEAAKEEIISQCEKGIRSFRLNAPTALATDWSRLAMGYWLAQKFCDCEGDIKPGCCPEGWQTVQVGSKFCTPAESRYHPIEGESCASAWALGKCRMFVLGHPNLILAVDHKPLLAIFSPEQELSEILNPRLMNFKMKTMAYRFKPIYIPGKAHVVPDTMSRRSDSPIAIIPKRKAPPPVVNNVLPAYSETMGPPTWVTPPSLSAILSPITSPSTAAESSASDRLEELLLGKVYAHLAAITPLASADIALFGAHNVEVLTWDRLEEVCKHSQIYRLLHQTVQRGVSDSIQDWDLQVKPYFQSRHGLSTLGHVVLLYDRPVIPSSLRQEVMEHLHASHGCANAMFQRACSTVYWPSYRQDINAFQAACSTCRRIAPSNPDMPPSTPLDIPEYPFQSICCDFFTHAAKNYLVIVDRYSNWLSVLKLSRDDSSNIIKALRDYFSHFGIASTFSTDGASVFTSAQTMEFCRRWGVKQRVSSAYYPRSNKRAEIGVKSAKRLIQDNLSPNGDLDTDRFARALLIHRNTPDPLTNLSPAQIVFGRNLRDHIPAPVGHFTPRKEWQDMAKKREESFLIRHYRKAEDLTRGSKQLPNLIPGDHVYIQDQRGLTPNKWHQSGVVLEALPHDSYLVTVDGSRHVTQRNRKFLRKFVPFNADHTAAPPQTNLSPSPVSQMSPPMAAALPRTTRSTRQAPPLLPTADMTSSPAPSTPATPTPPPSVADPPSPPTLSSTPPTGHVTLTTPPPPTFSMPAPPAIPVPYQLPKHLRERWIVAPYPGTEARADLTSIVPVTHAGWTQSPYQAAPTYFPMPVQHQLAAMSYLFPTYYPPVYQ